MDADNVRVAVTGAVYFDATSTAAAPTNSGSALAAEFNDLGYVSEDGVALAMPDAGDTTPIKAWQNGATVRVLRSSSEDNPQLTLTLIETTLPVIEAVFGVTVTQDTADGSFVINTTAAREPARLVLDVVDDAELMRIYAPKATVASIGEITFASTDAIGYEITLDLEFDQALGGQAKTWMTALKTAA